MELSVVMFWFASIWILPFWSLMWFVPKHALTQRFVGDLRWCFIPLLLPYVVLAAPQVGNILLTFASEMPTPQIVFELFEDTDVVMLGWFISLPSTYSLEGSFGCACLKPTARCMFQHQFSSCA